MHAQEQVEGCGACRRRGQLRPAGPSPNSRMESAILGSESSSLCLTGRAWGSPFPALGLHFFIYMKKNFTKSRMANTGHPNSCSRHGHQ